LKILPKIDIFKRTIFYKVKTSDLRKEIISRLDLLDEAQLKEVLLFIEKYSESRAEEPAIGYSTEDWELLPSWQQKRIEKANAFLDDHEWESHEDVVKRMKTKYHF
tara:strand:+ start:129 stop:446 length:318 start_codon:yes stop_codon:yes gene_type:complete